MHARILALNACLVLSIASLAGPLVAAEEGKEVAAQPADNPRPADDCRALFEQNAEKSKAFELAQMEKRKLFYAEQQTTAANHSSANHTESEWKEFNGKQAEASRSFEEGLQAESRSFHESLWREFQSQCGNPEPEISKDCREKGAAIHDELDALHKKWEERHRQFQADFEKARAQFMNGNHTPEEWKAFAEKWHGAARALFEQSRADMLALLEKHGLRECFEKMGGFEKYPVPQYEDRGEAHTSYSQTYTAAYGTPAQPASDPEFEKIRAECEAKMKAQAYGSQEGSQPKPAYPPNSDGRGGSAATAPPSGMEAQYRGIAQECEKRMREYYERHHGGEGSKDQGEWGSFKMSWDAERNRIIVRGNHLAMEGVPEAQMMTQISVEGKVLIDRLFVNGYLAEFRPAQTEEGTAIQVFDSRGSQILSVHDSPRGVINVASSGEIPSITLDLNDNLQLERTDEGVRFSYASWDGVVLVHDGSIEIGEGNALKIAGKATFLLTRAGAAEGGKLGPAYEDALRHKKIGAEVRLSKEGNGVKTDTTPIGDLEVKVRKEAPNKVSARVESPGGTGKTVVLKIEKGLLGEGKLKVDVVGINDDQTESALAVREADSLEDVLDPRDDGDVVEYWVVADKDGTQVLVSFPHFSEKKVTVESVGTGVLGVPLPGFEGLVAVAAIGAAVAVAALRRKA